MPSSIKTSVKTILEPIFGNFSIVPSCMKMQEYDISEKCSTEPKSENAILKSRDRTELRFAPCKGFGKTVGMARSDCGSKFLEAYSSPWPLVHQRVRRARILAGIMLYLILHRYRDFEFNKD